MRYVTVGLLALALATQANTQASPGLAPTYLPAAQVARAFDKGVPLIETELYKVHASRREAPGMAEVHERDTDIIHVLEGSAVIVTGGRVLDGANTSPNEIRGRAIEGGSEQRLGKGDVFIVPNGVPHRFSEVQGPFLYYVVKATGTQGGTR